MFSMKASWPRNVALSLRYFISAISATSAEVLVFDTPEFAAIYAVVFIFRWGRTEDEVLAVKIRPQRTFCYPYVCEAERLELGLECLEPIFELAFESCLAHGLLEWGLAP